MEQVRVIVEHRDDLPRDVPALWEEAPGAAGGERIIRLYLRRGLGQSLADHFRCMAVRSVMPEATFDRFTVTPVAERVTAVA